MDADRWERKRQRWERRWERRMALRRRHSPGRHLFSGFLFVGLGVVFLLGNMGYVDVDQVLRFWPLLLIGFGALRLVEARDDYAHSGGIFWIVVGLLFLLGSFGIIRLAMRDLWPVLLIGIGVLMLWRSMLARRERENLANPGATAAGPSPFVDTSTTASSNSTLSATAILGGVEKRNNSQDFRGGDATAILGGCHIDLRAASITPPHEAKVEVFAMWGGIEIHVPPDWTVVSQVDPILGGYEDKTLPPKDESKRFIIHGSVVMGGIEVAN
jgi:predicted membrane protein